MPYIYSLLQISLKDFVTKIALDYLENLLSLHNQVNSETLEGLIEEITE